MKRISLATLSVLGLSILACGGGDETTSTPTPAPTAAEPAPAPAPAAEPAGDTELLTVPLSDNWAKMDLPINDGQILLSDSKALLIAYEDGAISTYTSSYSPAIEKTGYKKADDYSSPEFTAILYTKDTQQLGFAVGHEDGFTFVYFEDLDGVPEEERVVSKKGGKANLGRAKGKAKGKAKRKKNGGGAHNATPHNGPNAAARQDAGGNGGGGKAGKGKGKGKKGG
jgi:hypothetical protein